MSFGIYDVIIILSVFETYFWYYESVLSYCVYRLAYDTTLYHSEADYYLYLQKTKEYDAMTLKQKYLGIVLCSSYMRLLLKGWHSLGFTLQFL